MNQLKKPGRHISYKTTLRAAKFLQKGKNTSLAISATLEDTIELDGQLHIASCNLPDFQMTNL